jgi:transcriptional regulator with XRE-family HTH domain
MKKINIDINELKKLYVDSKYNQRQLADHFGVSLTLINKRLKSLGISKSKPSKEFLYEHYIIKNMTQAEIGILCGLSSATIGKYLRNFSIEKTYKIDLHRQPIIKLFKDGFTYYAISKQLSCSLSTIYAVLEKEGLKELTKVYDDFDEQTLRYLYLDLNYSLEEVAKELNSSVTNVNKHILNYNITKPTVIYDLEKIKELYINNNLKQYEVAELMGIKLTTLQGLLARYNIVKVLSEVDINKLKKLCSTELSIQEIADTMGFSRTYIGQVIQKYNIARESLNKETAIERFIKTFLDTHNIEYKQNDRVALAGKEIDFYVPSKHIGIEICGLYWHSTKINSNKYHIYEKYKKAKDKDINLITIFEDEIINKPQIVINRLKVKLLANQKTIYARKTSISIISSREGIDFLNNYHIQGSGKNTIYIGLKYLDTLVAVMSFSKTTVAKGAADSEWELNRFASIDIVVGGASKLLGFFKKHYKPMSIISYADNRWNTGNIYSELGFILTHESKPNYWYVVNQQRKHRYSFAKHKLLEMFIHANTEHTEEQIAEANNLYRIYDCGNKVYKWVLS